MNEHQINLGEGLKKVHPNCFVAQSTTYDKMSCKIDVSFFFAKNGKNIAFYV
jgi:hypothetical protein